MRYTRGIVLLCSAIDFNATVSQFHQKKRGKRPHQRRGADEQKMLAVQLSPAASNERVLRI